MSRVFRYGGAVAAAAVLFVLVGHFYFADRGGVAFADVIENVRNAQSVTFVCHQQIGAPPSRSMRWYVEGDAARIEIPGQMQVVVDLQRKRQVQLLTAKKQALVQQFDERALRMHDDGDRQFARLFKNPMDYFRELTEDDAERIGRDELEGREVDVFRLKRFFGIEVSQQDDQDNITAWIDRRSGLPVRIAVRGSFEVAGKSKYWMLLEKFVWNRPLDPKLFSTEIPDGYTVVEQPDLLAPPETVKDALAALAEALKSASESTSVTCTAESGRAYSPPTEAKLYAEGEAARREIADMGIHVEDLKQGKALHVLPASQRAHRWNVDRDHPTEMDQRFPNPLALLRNIRSDDAEWHGPALLDGRDRWMYRLEKVDLQALLGRPIEVSNAEVVVMVDAKTRLPAEVSLHWTIPGAEETKAWRSWGKTEWNKPLDSRLFQLDVPEGYTIVEGEPTPDELAAEKEATPKAPEVEIDFARVIENVNQAESVSCTADSTAEQSHGITAFLHFQGDAARRATPGFFLQIEDRKLGRAIHVLPSAEQAYRWGLDEGGTSYAQQRFPNPALLFRNIKSKDAERTQIRRPKQGNAVAFRLKKVDLESIMGKLDEALRAELYVWVDPETLLPTEVSLGCRYPDTGRLKASFRWEQFEWNKPIDPDLFKLAVPDSYQLIEGPPPEGRLGPDLQDLMGARRPAGP